MARQLTAPAHRGAGRSLDNCFGGRLKRGLLTTTALVTCLAGLVAASIPASAQSVTISGDVNPASATSPDWDLGTASLIVGNSGDGTLAIEGGGTVSSWTGIIGSSTGSTGTVTVTGDGSTWTTSHEFHVGYAGNGMVNIVDGGVISSKAAIISLDSDSTSTVTVTGTGSIWSSIGWFYVGSGGTGILTVENGGAVSSWIGVIGSNSDATGTATVTGDGSTWTNSGELNIGYSGDGTLSVENGGTVSNTAGYIGRNSGSTGTATVTGNGSAWTNSDDLTVGYNGNGTLNIEAGGEVSNADGSIGRMADSTGAATVTGTGSTWTNDGFLSVGVLGDGTLTVSDGGTVTSTSGVVSNGPDSISTATVTGAGSTWTNTGLNVGNVGTGTLIVADGGTVRSTFNGIIANFENFTGTAIVTGNGSTWTLGSLLMIGASGNGALTIEDGGAVTSGDATIGYLAGSIGTATVTGDGSKWTSGYFTVGDEGTGALTIEDGGAAISSVGGLIGGDGGSGTVTVTGQGSTWKNSGELYVGYRSIGELTVEDGGAVTSKTSTIGFSPSSVGTATVTGDGSTWNSGALTVGDRGTGTLSVAEGGEVTTGGQGILGLSAGSAGTVTVAGMDSVWTLDNALQVGREGTGELIIADGGTVSVDAPPIHNFRSIGSRQDSTGAVTVTGTGSTWSGDGQLAVGQNGNGTLTVADGGAVSATDMAIAALAGSVGTLNIGAAAGDPAMAAGTLDAASVIFGEGNGTINFNHTGTGYEFASPITGNGTVNQLAGTTVLTGASTYTGATHVDGGTLLVEGALGNTATTVSSGATLGGSGSIGGDVTIADGAAIAPGSSAGTLTVGSLALSGGSILDYELSQPGVIGGGVNDLIVVTGDLTLDGTLDVTDIGGFGAGVYRLIDYGGNLTDNILDLGTLPAGVTADDLTVQTSVANQVNLINTAAAVLQFWDGDAAGNANNGVIDGGNGTWTATSGTWTKADGAVDGAMQPKPGFAIFQAAPGTVTADDSAGTLAVTGMQFATDGYRIEGDPITLAGAGGESIIRVGNGSAAGADYTATIASELTGTGSLVKTDLGTLVLSGTNSYQGGTTIADGTLEVSADANLGAVSGGLTLDGGTLRTTADIDSARPVTLAGTGGFEVATGTTLGLSGIVTGTGNLVKAGNGTLTLTGANSYQGNTLVSAGTLTGTVDSIRGDVGNAGTVVFDLGGDASFTGDIAGLGGVDGTMVKQGAGILTLTGGSTLDWTVRRGGLITAAERFAGNAAIDTEGTFTFDQTVDAQYAGTFSGAGDFIKTGTGTLLYDGDGSSFTGNTMVTDGGLIVGSDAANTDAALGGSFDVQDGGTLGGHGTIGSGAGSMVTIASGGTIAPGHSPGTLTIAGDIAFASGSIYEVDITPALESDLIDASGAATIEGGTVDVVKTPGTYTPGSRWTIVGADGGVTGTFDGLTQNMPFVDLALAYDTNNVYIDATRNQVAFCAVAGTFNQCSTGDGVETTGAGNPVYNAVASIPDEDSARRALDALSGEIHASAMAALIEDSRFVREAATARVRAAFDGVAVSSLPVMAYGPGGTAMAPATTDRFAAWGQAFGSWGSFDSDGNAAALDHDTGGFLTGMDGFVTENWRLGLIAGYSHSSFDAKDRASSGSSDNYHLGIYGGAQWGKLGFRTGAAYTWHDIDTSRSIAFPGFADSTEVSYDAATAQVFGELGYRLDTAAASFEPFANLAYVNLETDGFTEKGGAAALTVGGGSTDTTFTTLGLRASTGFTLGGMNATARGVLGWRHAFGDTSPLSMHAFAGGDAFAIAGVPIAEDAAVLEAGLDLAIAPNATLGLSYNGQIASDARQHGFKARLGIRF